ncbi:MAG: hypothetical protein AAGI08_02155 [Bacteroidota bacterium]
MRYFVLLLLLATPAYGQFVDDTRSDPNARRAFVINSNQVETDVTNYGTVARGGESPIGGVWPRGTGHDHIHEMTGYVAAQIVDRNGNRVIVISDGYTDSEGEIDNQTNVRQKFHPKPGYLRIAEDQEEIANSLNPRSWPASWPDKDSSFDGAWNGFFGLNQFNADQEVYYVNDDSWNTEFDVRPYASEPEWGGLGMQVSTRLFQWAHPLAKDILFIYYEVVNAGSIDYTPNENPIFFGGYADMGPGGRGTTDDAAAFEAGLDMVYGWDCDNVGVWTRNREIPPGYVGWKFLESPGIANDGIDNDADGLLDERRDNDAGSLIFGPVGIYGDDKEHWSGDEDGDWNPNLDDVGADGAGPLTEGYPGPDEGEGNGRPDQGEPNFGRLDNDESDQVGLTSFTAPLFGAVLITDEENVWPRIQPNFFTVPQQCVNQYWIFGSGPFNLRPGQTERFSTCWLFGFDEQAVFQNAVVAQQIFDSDYRFAKPPIQPTLTAISGDGQVTLIWDDLAEQGLDPVYGRDFEGYRVYRSTDPQFLDAEDITDALGNPVFKKPVIQFDLANGLTGPHPLQFGEEIGAPTGIHYFMGNDTGLEHYFVDTDVINGRTYYYAVTAYDAGYDNDFFERGISELEFAFPITPSESPASIRVVNGEIEALDRNTAVATPNPEASNLITGGTDVETLDRTRGVSTGDIQVEVVNRAALTDANYRVDFKTEAVAKDLELETVSFSVLNETTDEFLVEDAPVPINSSTGQFRRNWTSEFLDAGLVLRFENQLPNQAIAQQLSGWTGESETNLLATVMPLTFNSPRQPISFVIEVFEEGSGVDSTFTNATGRRLAPVDFKVYELDTQEPLDFVFFDQDNDGAIDVGETVYLAYRNRPNAPILSSSWSVTFEPPLDADNQPRPEEEWVLPEPGDTYIVRNQLPFSERDTYRFSTIADQDNTGAGEALLDEIKVVPNPYLGASILERQPFLSGRGERFIRFINLPAQATIRIYTVSGDLIQELQNDNDNDGVVYWDLLTKDNLEVSFGLYVYHVEAPGIGEKVGKFAIVN